MALSSIALRRKTNIDTKVQRSKDKKRALVVDLLDYWMSWNIGWVGILDTASRIDLVGFNRSREK